MKILCNFIKFYSSFIIFILFIFYFYGCEGIKQKAQSVLFPLKNNSLPCRFPVTGEFYLDDGGQRILKIDVSHFETKGDCVRAGSKDFFVVRRKR